MAYIELSKLYYGDVAAYQTAYRQRFDSMNAVKPDFSVKGRPVFYLLTQDVYQLATDILRADKQIALLRARLPGVAIGQFTKRCLIDEIVVTNRIEGVHSTRREISSILDELESKVTQRQAAKRFDGLVRKYRMLQGGSDIPLRSCADIRALYDELVLPEVVQENRNNAPDGMIFRKDSASVNSPTDKELHRGLFPESEIIAAMDKALQFLWDGQIDVLHRICLFHYLMEYIHPFYDGNGRTGRFIVSYLLSRELDPLLAYRLSVTIAENLRAYYRAFETCNDPHDLGDLTPFLLMMLEMIRTSSQQLVQALEKRAARLDKLVRLIPALPGGENARTRRAYDILIQAGLFSEHGVTIEQFKDFLGCGKGTAEKELRIIDEAKLLHKQRVSRAYCYEADIERLDALLMMK